jgi:hypothetical protein
MIKFSADFAYNFKMTVCGINEHAYYNTSHMRRETTVLNIKKRFNVDDKSTFKVMRKLAMLFEDRLNFLIKFGKVPIRFGLSLFIVKCY